MFPFKVRAGLPVTEMSFWIDAADSFRIAVGSTRNDFGIRFIAPDGAILPFDPNASTNASWMAPDPATTPISSAWSYNAIISNPLPGQWTLQVAPGTPLSADLDTFVHLTYANRVAPYIAISRTRNIEGGPVVATLAVVDGASRIKNLQIEASIFKSGDVTFTPLPVAFKDDGTGFDTTSGDGSYCASLDGLSPGIYYIRAQIQGQASTGRFHRSGGVGFQVFPRKVRILGTYSDRGIAGYLK